MSKVFKKQCQDFTRKNYKKISRTYQKNSGQRTCGKDRKILIFNAYLCYISINHEWRHDIGLN